MRTAVSAVRIGTLVVVLTGILASAADTAETVSLGPWRVSVGERGLEVRHDDLLVSLGSYFAVFTPGYKGSLVNYGQFWAAAKTSHAERCVRAEAKLPEGSATYEVSLDTMGVLIDLRITLTEGTKPGPTEYAVLQFPPDLVRGGKVETLNVAGTVIDTKPIPDEAVRGGMARNGDLIRVHTTKGVFEVASETGVSIYPFDARVPQYGKRQGLWAFSGIPVSPGHTTRLLTRLRLLPPATPRAPGNVTFADGTPLARITVSPTASDRERFAANELADYIEAICACRVPVEQDAGGPAPTGTLVVGAAAVESGLVSTAELSALPLDGHVVRVRSGRGAVCGRRDLGTIYAAYALLKQMGVRFYAPGCERVPQRETLTVPDRDVRRAPLLEFRKVTQSLKLGHTPADDLGNPGEFGERGNLVHAAAYLVPYETYGEKRPELFALQKDGKRLHFEEGARRVDVHLCLSNPDVRRISAERMIALIEKQPDRMFFGISQGDGFAWCQCEECKAQDTVPGKVMTDRLLDYVNAVARQVAERYPDKRLLTLAYTTATSPPPIRVKPEPNVMVQFCSYPGRVFCQSHDLTCEKNSGGQEDLKGWFRLCPDNMYIFDYPRGYKIYYEPFGSFYAMKRKMDLYLANGVRGIYYCGVPTNFQDLFIFVQSAMHWDRNVDVEALIDEFVQAYYHAAAPFIRQYFDFMHGEVERRGVHQMCEGANPGLATDEYVTRALAMFAAAEAAVAEDRTALYRVKAEKFCVLFADLNERNPANGQLAVGEAEFARRLAEFMELARLLRRRVIGRREAGIVSDWLYRVCRVRTLLEPWYMDPLCRRLQDDPLGTFLAERKAFCQKTIPGGILIELDAFTRCRGPEEYSHQCPARRAVWIYGTNTKTPEMRAEFHLDSVPADGAGRLVLTAQDDDKPEAVDIEILVNGKSVFRGPNGFREKGRSVREFTVPTRALTEGRNALCIRTVKPSPARDSGWFMLAEARVMFGVGP